MDKTSALEPLTQQHGVGSGWSSLGRKPATACNTFAPSPNSSASGAAARIEGFLKRHPRLIFRVQAVMVGVYLLLILVPPFLPSPGPGSTPLNNFVSFSQFAIWSIWWPFVLLSVVLFGRAWCGLLCPEGALAQAASRVAMNRQVPKWMTWGGAPLMAFLAITAIGQLLEVDEHPLSQLLVLGGSTLLAVSISLVFTRDSRIWCRFLCPVSMLFGVFSRLGAATFHVDRARLEASLSSVPSQKQRCPVLIHLPVMSTSRDCHMCFGCAGWRDAIHLRFRRPGEELEKVHRAQPLFWEVMFLFGGAIGLPLGVFYAEAFDLKGVRLLGSLFAGTAIVSVLLSLLTLLSARTLQHRPQKASWRELFVRTGYAYAPVSLLSLFLGLSQPTFEFAVSAGLPEQSALVLRAVLLLLGAGWALFTAYRIFWVGNPPRWRVQLAFVPYLTGLTLVVGAWARILL